MQPTDPSNGGNGLREEGKREREVIPEAVSSFYGAGRRPLHT